MPAGPGPDAREAAVQVLEEYGAKQLVLPEGAYVGRDLELALGDALPVPFEAADSVSLWAGVSAQVLPQWEGLLLTVHGVEVLVEWDPGQSPGLRAALHQPGGDPGKFPVVCLADRCYNR